MLEKSQKEQVMEFKYFRICRRGGIVHVVTSLNQTFMVTRINEGCAGLTGCPS